MKFDEMKQRLDPKCWTGKKIGNPKTKVKGGVRVNNCVPAESVEEDWSQKYKDSINCSNPKGFSQKAHCAGKAKNESVEEAYGPWGKKTPQDIERIKKHLEREKKNTVPGQLRKSETPTKKTQYNRSDALSYFTSLEESNPEYDDEAGMAQGSLHTLKNAVQGLSEIIDAGDNLPEWCQEKISLAEDYLVTVWDYIQSEKAQGIDPEIEEMYEAMEELAEEMAAKKGVSADLVWETFEAMDDNMLYETAAWRRKEGKNKNGGLNAKGVASYRRENPGSKLQTAVTTKPSKLKKGSKAAKRRKSFCARMSGVKGPMKKPNGKPTRKALALRKWNC